MNNPGRTCRDCDNYRESNFCGYIQSLCKIYDSLDVDQQERHPDITAATCKEFTPKRPKGPETEAEALQRMLRALWPNGCRTR